MEENKIRKQNMIVTHIMTVFMILSCFSTGFTVFDIAEPNEVYAEDNLRIYEITLGTKELDKGENKENAPAVWYADNEWQVVGYDVDDHGSAVTEVACKDNATTLWSAKSLGDSIFNDKPNAHNPNNFYSSSELCNKVNDISDKIFSDAERGAVIKRYLEGRDYNYDEYTCDWIRGDSVQNACLWPLSAYEANILNESLRRIDTSGLWWLRSPGAWDSYAGFVDRSAEVIGNGAAEGHASGIKEVRPAFHLNNDSVLCITAAENGKDTGEEGADALKGVDFYEPSDEKFVWKVTLKSGHEDFKITKCRPTEDGVTINYTGAEVGTTEKPEYISAVITDKPITKDNAHIIYYGRIQKCTSESGTVTINTEGKQRYKDDTLYVFNEQYNGDKKTDYASELKEVTIPGQISQEVTFRVVNGSWNDGTKSDKKVTLTGYEGDSLKLAPEDIPGVGNLPNENYVAGSWNEVPSIETEIDGNKIYTYTYTKAENKSAGSKIMPLRFRSTKQTKNSIKLAWNKASGATKYVIYGNLCGSKYSMKKLKVTTGKTYNVKKIAGKKLKKGKYYKFTVVALDSKDHVISTSKMIYVTTKGGKRGNYSSVKVTAKVNAKGKKIKSYKKLSKTVLKQGKTLKLKSSALGKSVKKHVGLRYESSNPGVATVSGKGKIKAVSKGKANIIVYAQNGKYKTVKVTVK